MKILLITHARSGSTVYCEEHIKKFKPTTPYPMLEPCNPKWYGTKKQSIDFVRNCGVVDNEWLNDFKKVSDKVVLNGLKQDEFIIKYMTSGIHLYPNMSIMADLCEENKVEVHTLYRESLEDCLVSYVIAKINNVWHIRNNNKISKLKIDQTLHKPFIDFAIKDCLDAKIYFKKIVQYFDSRNLITKRSTYEK